MNFALEKINHHLFHHLMVVLLVFAVLVKYFIIGILPEVLGIEDKREMIFAKHVNLIPFYLFVMAMIHSLVLLKVNLVKVVGVILEVVIIGFIIY